MSHTDETPTLYGLMAEFETATALVAAANKTRSLMLVQMVKVLTPEQRKKAETLRERMRERGKDRMRHGGGKPHALILEESDEIG